MKYLFSLKYLHGFVEVVTGGGHGHIIQAQVGSGVRLANVRSQLLPEYGYVHWHM